MVVLEVFISMELMKRVLYKALFSEYPKVKCRSLDICFEKICESLLIAVGFPFLVFVAVFAWHFPTMKTSNDC